MGMEDIKKIYIVLGLDMHIDPFISVFEEKDSAIVRAIRFVKDNAEHPETIRVHKDPEYDFYATYSEGDSVIVFESNCI